MTDMTETKMNVAALKRVDPYIKDILETATHVALYTFNADSNEWEKTDIEGALFVYSRNGEPYNSILIMNRLNTNNLVEPVTLGLDLQLQEPFLLYRNSKSDIYGIWFYDKVECIRIAAMLNTLVKDSELSRKVSVNTTQKSNKVSKPNTNNVDIFSMLSKAQEVFNTNRGGEATSIGSKSPVNSSARDISCPLSAPLGPDVTSQSVMDFFARAKVNTGHFKAGDHPNAHNVGVAENKPMLARLMSHPAAHTLEHIEKQQRSTTPQPGLPSHLPAQLQSPSVPQANNVAPGSSSNRGKRHNKSNVTQDDSVVSALTSVSQELQRQVSRNTSDTNGASSFLRIDSPGVKNSPNLTNHQSNDIAGSCKTDPILSLFETDSTTLESEDMKASRPLKGRGTGPALIPPVMFGAPSPSEPLSRPLEPLTRNQLLQAFNYLLRSDPDFVNKLHEAYVKSFGEILS